ncbi:MAG TPA: polymer-forming cytoskeletal protein [Polyangiaceae bacterium]|jgi:hypothetical protein
MKSFAWGRVAAVAGALVMLAAGTADAHVTRQGAWPDADKAVTLDLDGVPRRDALRKLADAAGWSLVVHAPAGDPVDVHVKGQPASKVMEILLDDGDYTAKRDGTLVSIERTAPGAAGATGATSATGQAPTPSGIAPPAPPVPAAAPVPPTPPRPPAPPAPPSPSAKDLKIQIGGPSSEIEEPHKRGTDRTVMGGNVNVAKGEVVRDLTVFGGNVDISGDATGDVTVFGGEVKVHEGGHVKGDATVFGGELSLANGSKVDGDVSCVGGSLDRDPGAQVGGDVSVKDGAESEHEDGDKPAPRVGFLRHTASSLLDGVRGAAVLFVIGTMLLALAGRRMEQLRVEVAARPMRSIALGMLGSFLGLLLIIALCITVIGSPIAVVVAIVGAFGVLAAMCAVLSVVGEGLVRHRTENPYVHLAVGCGLFVLLSAIPWVGGIVVALVMVAGVGVLVATRGAGYFVKKNGGGTPYRTPDTI